MTTKSLNSSESDLPEWFDPFPEPHTIPGNWNLDGFMLRREPRPVEQPEDAAVPQPADLDSRFILHA